MQEDLFETFKFESIRSYLRSGVEGALKVNEDCGLNKVLAGAARIESLPSLQSSIFF
jgi:hypothetical protein